MVKNGEGYLAGPANKMFETLQSCLLQTSAPFKALWEQELQRKLETVALSGHRVDEREDDEAVDGFAHTELVFETDAHDAGGEDSKHGHHGARAPSSSVDFSARHSVSEASTPRR